MAHCLGVRVCKVQWIDARQFSRTTCDLLTLDGISLELLLLLSELLVLLEERYLK